MRIKGILLDRLHLFAGQLQVEQVSRRQPRSDVSPKLGNNSTWSIRRHDIPPFALRPWFASFMVGDLFY
jgi:hypothetical protein